jgi:hypothetical protein
MSQLPMRDMWRHTCTLRRDSRSRNEDFQVLEHQKDVLVNEPCALTNKTRSVQTANGTVWRSLPRMSISPKEYASRPQTNDAVEIDGRAYQVVDITEITDYDGSYMGSVCNLKESGVVDDSD